MGMRGKMRRFINRLLSLFRSRRADEELDREVASHLALLEDEHLRRGVTPGEASLAARRAMGSLALAKDLHQDARSFTWIDDLRRDLHHAARNLRRTPGLTIAVALTIALGIGASTTMFSVVYGVLLRPLPYPEPDRLMRVWELNAGATTIQPGMQWLSNVSYYAWSEVGKTIDAIGTFSSSDRIVGFDRPTRIACSTLSPSTFKVLRASPALGRFFTDDDARDGATPVVVLSTGLWRERFGADPEVLGRAVFIDGAAHIIVGVAPPDFAFPYQEVRLWAVESVPRPGAGTFGVVGASVIARLAKDTTPMQAAAEATAIARSQARPPATEILWGKGGPVEVHVRPIVTDLTARVRTALLLALAAVGCLLLIACANVANLLLARIVSREREVAVRTALGASRGRVIRQFLTESVVMSLLGGLLGIALAFALVRAMPALVPQPFPRVDNIRVDGLMLAVACALTLVSGVLSGLAPAARGARQNFVSSLREGSGSSAGSRADRLRRLLLGTEAALAVMVLVVALLVGRSLSALLAVDPGYEASNVVTARVYMPQRQAGQMETDPFVAALLDRIRAVPGVVAAGAGAMAPFGRINMATQLTVTVPGRAPVSARSRVYVVTPGYAEALRLRLRSGRLFTESDLASGVQTMLVNEEFVRAFLQGTEPIGFLTDSLLTRGVRGEVVGVVDAVLKEGLNSEPQPEVYVVPAHRYVLAGEVHVLVRSSGEPAPVIAALRETIGALRPDVAMDATTLQAQTLESVGKERLAAAALAGFALMALLLAAVGLYGVMSQAVSTRVRELGVRTALGASGGHIARSVVGEGMRTTGAGLAIGLVGAAALTRVIESMLFGVTPLDPLSFAIAAVVLSAVALGACVLPARRAARVDPLVALRTE
jgi:putative ABC transport system permease protein